MAGSVEITGINFSIHYHMLIIFYNITGWPRPELEWLKNGKPSPGNPFIIDQEMNQDRFGVFTGSRIFDPIGSETGGLYTLIATNRIGSANRSVNITGEY